jgi:hypothetical protein
MSLRRAFLFDLGDARVLAAGFQQHFAHVFGVVFQRRSHRVEADDPLGLLCSWAILPLAPPLANAGGGWEGVLLGRSNKGNPTPTLPCIRKGGK